MIFKKQRKEDFVHCSAVTCGHIGSKSPAETSRLFVPGCGGCGFQWGLLMASWGWFSSIWPFWDFKWMLEINRHLRSQARVGNHPHDFLRFHLSHPKLKLCNCDRLVWHREQYHRDDFPSRVVHSVWWLKGWRCSSLYYEPYAFGVSGYAQDVHHSSLVRGDYRSLLFLRKPRYKQQKHSTWMKPSSWMQPRLVLKLAAYKVRGPVSCTAGSQHENCLLLSVPATS